MPEPQYAYPYWMTQGRTQPRYYLPTITRPRAPTYPEVPWSSQPLFTGGIPNSYYNPPPQPGMPAPTHSGGLFDQQALTHGGGVLDAQALAQAQAGTQGQAGTAPHGLVQVWNLANRLLGQARQYAPPDTTAAGGGGGDGGGGGGAGPGGGGRGTVPAPAGIDVDWYAEFQRQHGGQTPEQYYARTGETLAHAMADEEWARGFAEMYGRPPTDDDWRAHWFSSRVGYTPEEYERWKMRQIARQEIRRTPPAKEKQPEQRPPVYQPPFITWR